MKFEKTLSWIIIIVSILVLIGWVLDIDFFKTISIKTTTMKISTAICFLLSGINLLIFSENIKVSRKKKYFIIASSILIIIFLGYIFTSVLSGKYTLLEKKFLIEDKSNVAPSEIYSYYGVPSLATMLAFILVQISFLILLTKHKKENIQNFLNFLIIIIGFIGVIGNSLKVDWLYYTFSFWQTGMAMHTAILFVFLGGALHLITKR